LKYNFGGTITGYINNIIKSKNKIHVSLTSEGAKSKEINYKGTGKRNNKEYCEEMSVSGTTPAIAYPVYENGLVEKQNMLKVDAVTGATYSLYRFRYAVTLALMKARLEYVKDKQ